MISTRFCPVCGAANDDTRTRCFACDQLLPADPQDEDEHTQEGTLLCGRYRLGTKLGTGGYGAVYRGWDIQENGRTVAIKQINLHDLDAEETIEATNTYNREVEALSALSHPQVPRLYDYFSDPNHWYLVLEYIEGQTLESYLERRENQGKPLQLEEILGTALQLCVVLTYLHSRQPPVIYRDLKPDNIMRTAGGKLYLIDFGIARRYTPGRKRDTQSLGSPGYAAPEQYGKAQTDARADIYSLGALLHQLLTGKDPLEREPGLLPQRFQGQTGGADLGKLVARMLAIAPLYRPASAQDVARELERIRQQRINALNSRRIWVPPVPQNAPYITAVGPQVQVHLPKPPAQPPVVQPKRKRLTRRRVVALVGVASVASIGLGVGLYFTMDNQAISSPPAPSPVSPPLFTYTGHSDSVSSLSWSPDGTRIASASTDKTVQVWNALTGGDADTFTGHTAPVNAVAWSPDGQYIVSGSSDGEIRLRLSNNYATSSALLFASGVRSLAWAPGLSANNFAASFIEGGVTIQNVKTMNPIPLKYQAGVIASIAYSPDGWSLATGGQDAKVMIWDTKTYARVYATYQGHTNPITSVVWLPNGVYLASASLDATIHIWSANTGITILTYRGHTNIVNALAVSPNGQYIASASDDQTVRVWSVDDGSTLEVYRGHRAGVLSVAWSPDGQYIVSGGADNTAQVWNAPTPPSS